jgi:hypothetical protein
MPLSHLIGTQLCDESGEMKRILQKVAKLSGLQASGRKLRNRRA